MRGGSVDLELIQRCSQPRDRYADEDTGDCKNQHQLRERKSLLHGHRIAGIPVTRRHPFCAERGGNRQASTYAKGSPCVGRLRPRY